MSGQTPAPHPPSPTHPHRRASLVPGYLAGRHLSLGGGASTSGRTAVLGPPVAGSPRPTISSSGFAREGDAPPPLPLSLVY